MPTHHSFGNTLKPDQHFKVCAQSRNLPFDARLYHWVNRCISSSEIKLYFHCQSSLGAHSHWKIVRYRYPAIQGNNDFTKRPDRGKLTSVNLFRWCPSIYSFSWFLSINQKSSFGVNFPSSWLIHNLQLLWCNFINYFIRSDQLLERLSS